MTLVVSTPNGIVDAVVEVETVGQGPLRCQVVDLPAGPTGPKGDTGAQGATGATGPTGPAGGSGTTGSFTDTFSGGAAGPFTAANVDANIGDHGWNTIGTFGAGASMARLAGELGGTGLWRLSSSNNANTGPSIYLGISTAGSGVIFLGSMNSFTWRGRHQAPTILQQYNAFQLANAPTLATQNQVIEILSDQSNANYRTRTRGTGGSGFGLPNIKDTGVPIDGALHDFKVVRDSALQYRFFIDGVLRTTHTDTGAAGADAVPLTTAMMPAAMSVGAATGGTSVDVDDFQFVAL